ncbi:MAG: ECF transporter S component [Clostridia bacterium]|nr:ECF transporter S component [Clostridia bacterium]MBR3685417.1 ECF transporter S component [Clostridia bacterium]
MTTNQENNKTECVGESQETPTQQNSEQATKKRKMRNATAYITKVAVLSAVATVLYFFARFPIFSVPPFNVLDMDFSDIPALIGGFALGPVASVIIAFIRCAIKLTTSTTAFVGELSAFVVSISFTLPATIIYKYKKNIKGALIGLGVGILSNAIISALSNYFIMVPMYAALYSPALMEVRVQFAFMYGLAFNLIKTVVASVITFILYKRLSKILHL